MTQAHFISLWESAFCAKKAPFREYMLRHALCNVGWTIFRNCCAITYLLTNSFNRKSTLCRQRAPLMHEQIQPEGLVFCSVQLSHPCPPPPFFWVNFTSPINRLNLCTLSSWSLIKYLQVTMGPNLYWFRSMGSECEEHPYYFPLLQTVHAFAEPVRCMSCTLTLILCSCIPMSVHWILAHSLFRPKTSSVRGRQIV